MELFFSVPLDTLLGIPGGIDALLSSSIQAGALDPNHDLLPNDFITGAVVNQTPLPAALPLFATGLGALGLLGWRRKKKAAA